MTKVRATAAYAEDAQDASIPVAGVLTVTKVVREYQDLRIRPGYGESIGQMVDQYLVNCLMNGEDVRDITVNFSDEMWAKMKEDAR